MSTPKNDELPFPFDPTHRPMGNTKINCSPKIVVKRSNMSGFRTSCSLCGEMMYSRAGPWLYLDGPGHEPVCKPCAGRHDPETASQMERQRETWRG